jgi:hypothetical protein
MTPEIIDLLGHAAAARLALAVGGREIRVPTRRQGRTWDALVQAIGAEAAARFCDYFAGERLYIPSDQKLRTEHNRRRAAEMRARGESWDAVGQALGYSARGARKLLAKRHSGQAVAMLDALEGAPPQ